MENTRSSDGTSIAFETLGAGPPVILVVGAFNDRSTGRPLAEALAAGFTVLIYDRRGRGDSGDTAPYAVRREVEDIGALVREAGGAAALFGYSSGALLALEAAAAGVAVTGLALYEAPPVPAPGAPGADHAARLAELVASGRRGEAVEYFQTEIVGIPAEVVARLRNAPFRGALEKMAHTLVYEATILAEGPRGGSLAAVSTPALVLVGGASPPVMREASSAMAAALPAGRLEVLDGQGHDLVAPVLAPVLTRFLTRPGS